MKRIYSMIWIISLILSMHTGCGMEQGATAMKENGEKGVVEEYNWKSLPVNRARELTNGEMLSVKAYIMLEHENPGDEYSRFSTYAVRGNCFYTFTRFATMEETLTVAERYDVSSKTTVKADNADELPPLADNEEDTWHVGSIRDGQGYEYTLNEDANRLTVRDAEGNEIINQDYSSDRKNYIKEPFYSGDGTPIFPLTTQNGEQLIWVDTDSGGVKTLAAFEEEYVRRWYLLHGNCIYYGLAEYMVRWNLETGVRERIFSFDDNGVNSVWDTDLLVDETGQLWLRVHEKDEDWIVALTGEPVEKGEAVRVANLVQDSNMLKSSIATFNRRNPQSNLVYEKALVGEEEAYRDRIFAELVAGKGPDVLFVTQEDMYILAEKGITAELRDYLPPDILQEVLPAVKEMGTIENRLVGLTPEVYIYTLITNREVWPQDTWSLQDICELLEEREELKGIYTYQQGDVELYNHLFYMVGINLRQPEFIDWDTGESHLEGGLYKELLQLLKEYCVEERGEPLDAVKRLKEGTHLATWRPVYSGYDYSGALDDYGDGGFAVGFPNAEGSGNYLKCRGVLLVNAKTTNQENIKGWLAYLFGTECQMEQAEEIAVRTDIIEDMIGESYDGRYTWRTTEGYILMNARSDGTAYVDDFAEYLENCVPWPYIEEAVFDILWEEAEAYFAGKRNLEQVLKITDNRVQLYLDEQK